ncbi:MAG: YutD-like domain-containing protein [Acholeplasmataceae bacterium]|jgi:uncharacterized protein YutD
MKVIVETEHGKFDLIKNYRDAFDPQAFNERYVDVSFKQYDYIVGDVSSGILRLKGFGDNEKGKTSYKLIPDYLNDSCNYNTPYYILKRIKGEVKDGRRSKKNTRPNKTVSK